MGNDEECYALLRQMRLFDDLMMQACFSDKDTVQYVLRIILDRDITVEEVSVQKDSEPSEYHGARFDVLAVDKDGRQCDIEIQQQDDGNLVKRAGFYSSVLGRSALKKNRNYDEFRETFVIFITAKDVFGRGLAVYHIERRFADTLDIFDDGSHIAFVNGEYKGNDDIGSLVHDMRQVDPDKMQSKVLSNRMKMFKEVDKEGKPMSELSKKLIDLIRKEVDEEALKREHQEGISQGVSQGISQGISQGRISTARAMLERNLDIGLIADCTGLPKSEVAAMAGK